MKKIILFAVAIASAFVTLVSCTLIEDDFSVAEISRDYVVFLYSPTCSYSNMAKRYVENTYANAKVSYIDVDKSENEQYLKAARKDYKLGTTLQTPIICFGSQHIEGWDSDKQRRLDIYIQPYLK